jgi:hypothetical protein
MNPAEFLKRLMVEGVSVALSSGGTISVTGDQSAVDKWLPLIRDREPGILRELHQELRREIVRAMLKDQPDKPYAVYVVDASANPLVVIVGIRNIVTFEMEIPQRYYNHMVLMELIEIHTEEWREYLRNLW